MVVKMAGLGRSFAGVAAYCLPRFSPRAVALECPRSASGPALL